MLTTRIIRIYFRYLLWIIQQSFQQKKAYGWIGMTHADSAALPDYIESKSDFWEHVYVQLSALLEGEQHWVRTLFFFATYLLRYISNILDQ